jgi:hypothetical protein
MIDRALPILGILAEGILLKNCYDNTLWERCGILRHAPLFAPSLLALTLRSFKADPAPTLFKKVVWYTYVGATNTEMGLLLCRYLKCDVFNWPAERKAQIALAAIQSVLGIGIIVSLLIDEKAELILGLQGEKMRLMKIGVLFCMAVRFALDATHGTKEPCDLRIAIWAGTSLSSCALLFKELLK